VVYGGQSRGGESLTLMGDGGDCTETGAVGIDDGGEQESGCMGSDRERETACRASGACIWGETLASVPGSGGAGSTVFVEAAGGRAAVWAHGDPEGHLEHVPVQLPFVHVLDRTLRLLLTGKGDVREAFVGAIAHRQENVHNLAVHGKDLLQVLPRHVLRQPLDANLVTASGHWRWRGGATAIGGGRGRPMLAPRSPRGTS
jgi:hypothetical protein